LRGNGGKELSREEGAAALGAPQAVSQSDMAIQTGGDGGGGGELEAATLAELDGFGRLGSNKAALSDDNNSASMTEMMSFRRRSISLDDILGNSYVHETENGDRIIISRGWPTARVRGRRRSHSERHRRRRPSSDGRNRSRGRKSRSLSANRVDGNKEDEMLSEEQKRRLLMEFLHRSWRLGEEGGQLGGSSATTIVLGREMELETALRIGRSQTHFEPPAPTRELDAGRLAGRAARGPGRLVVEYELPAHSGGPIALAADAAASRAAR